MYGKHTLNHGSIPINPHSLLSVIPILYCHLSSFSLVRLLSFFFFLSSFIFWPPGLLLSPPLNSMWFNCFTISSPLTATLKLLSTLVSSSFLIRPPCILPPHSPFPFPSLGSPSASSSCSPSPLCLVLLSLFSFCPLLCLLPHVEASSFFQIGYKVWELQFWSTFTRSRLFLSFKEIPLSYVTSFPCSFVLLFFCSFMF